MSTKKTKQTINNSIFNIPSIIYYPPNHQFHSIFSEFDKRIVDCYIELLSRKNYTPDHLVKNLTILLYKLDSKLLEKLYGN